MLYLFGRLALSDSLSYQEDYQDYDYQENIVRNQHPEQRGADARTAAISRRLRRSRHLPQSSRAAKCTAC